MTQRFSWQKLRDSGSFWMAMAGLCFGVMGVFVKLGSTTFSTAELVFYRCLTGLLTILAVVLPQRLTVIAPPAVLKLHLTRSISGFASLLLYFYAIAHLPLPTAVTLNYTSPIFLLLLTLSWQHQWPQGIQVLAMLVGFAGVVLLLRPTFSAEQSTAGLLGLGSGLLAGIAYLNVSELGRTGEPEWRTVLYFSLISSLGAGVLMLLQSEPLAAIRWNNVWIIVGMGAAATCAQLAMTRAYCKGKSLTISSLAYLTVVFSTLFGMLIWHDVLPPLSYLGMALIIATGILTTLAQRRE